MARLISHLSDVHPRARIGNNVSIGPFCTIGSEVVLGDDCILDSHVVLTGNTVIGAGNRFWPHTVIGGEPQDRSWQPAATGIVIGDDNEFREGVTVHRGADKEDGTTRIGHRNMFMSNSHVAHNCWVFNDVILVNGVLLGGHVHVHDGAIISGNSAVHHFATVGTLAFMGGTSRATVDIPPYMLHSGSDDPTVRMINLVGMRRRGIAEETIVVVRRAFKLIYREHRKIQAVRECLQQDYPRFPPELETLISFIEYHQGGRAGRGRDGGRGGSFIGAPEQSHERAIRRAA